MATERYSGSSLYELIKEKLVRGTTVKEKVVTLTGDVDILVENNPRRLGLIFTLLTDGLVYVSHDSSLLGIGGLMLMGKGANISFWYLEDFEAVGIGYYAKGSAGDKVHVYEIVAL